MLKVAFKLILAILDLYKLPTFNSKKVRLRKHAAFLRLALIL